MKDQVNAAEEYFSRKMLPGFRDAADANRASGRYWGDERPKIRDTIKREDLLRFSGDPVFRGIDPKGKEIGYFFWNEVWIDFFGPYETVELADEGLAFYASTL